MLKKAETSGNQESRQIIRENRTGLIESDDSQASSEENRLDVVEEIPFKEIPEEINGIQDRLSAGGFGEAAKSPRNLDGHQEKTVIRENCIELDNDSNSDPEDLSKTEQSEQKLDEFPFKEMAEEIKGMNETLDRLQARFSIDVKDHMTKLSINLENEMGLDLEDMRWLMLHGSKVPAIGDLQINARRLRCQLADLMRCSELGATSLLAMNRQTIRQSNDLRAYRKQYESVHSFHLAHELEAGRCLMRYRHCKDVYSSWRELYQMGNKATEAYSKILEITQTRGHFFELKKQVLQDISKAHESCVNSSTLLAKRVEEMGHTMGISITRPSKVEPQPWKNYTGPPVVVKSTHWQGRYNHTVRFSRGELLDIPVVVPPTQSTWYGRMQANLLRGSKMPKTQDSVKRK